MAKKITDVNGNVYVQKKPFYKKWWFWLLLLILIGGGIGSQDNKRKEVEIKTTDNASQENKKDEPKKEEKAKYEIKDIKIEDNGFAKYVTGVLVNNTNSDKSYVQISVPAYDSQGNKVSDAFDNVNNLKANGTWKFKAMYLGSEKDVNFKLEEIKVSGF